ncbi:NAD(P)/FAD-dependent oxidoreductase [Patescibacteria group bacterium]|nr:NAD(P)/FAD-dependent oxidoreductase [Patescibacteria group bacterium]
MTDLIVIGGGPAGMILAGRAAENSARVLLLEKNEKLGVKLLITGKGRCNIANAEADIKKIIQQFGKNGKFLYSALYQFNAQKIVDFFENLGVKTKTERGNRIFPVSNKSADILNALIKYLKKNKVKIRTNSEVKDIVVKKNIIQKIILKSGEELIAKNYAICTGGKSYPATGASGDGYKWLKKMGHNIILPTPSLVPIILKEKYIKDLEGLSLKNVNISVFQNNKKQDERFGEAIFTANGMSGPIILDMSKKINELLNKGQVILKIDFKPALEFKILDKRIQNDFSKMKNKMFKNSLDLLLPKKMILVIIKLSKIDGEKKTNSITKEERNRLLHLLKDFKLEVKKIDGFNKAIVTAGGVDLKEINPKTMKSKIINNLFIAGEVLDLDGPTGGYNLEASWSTGYCAGDNF